MKRFTKNGKTFEEIQKHYQKQKEKHNTKMRNKYRETKMIRNQKTYDLFLNVYSKLQELGYSTDITEMIDKIPKATLNSFKCVCFDKLTQSLNI